jgi:regulator of RNase E activity RraA
VHGRALTVRIMPVRGRRASALRIYDAIAQGEPGDFLVVEAPYPDEVVVGDLVVTAAVAAGFAGILLDGYARDRGAVTKASIGIWARGLNLLRPNYLEVASIGEPVVCGGAQVHTGDLVIADADGAVIVPPEELDLLGRAVAHIEVVERDVKEAINRQASPSEIATLLGRKSQIPDAR